MNLVTIEEAKEHLLYEHNADDLRIADLVEDASFVVLNYLKRGDMIQGFTDVDGVLLSDADGLLFINFTSAQAVDSNGDLLWLLALDSNGDPIIDSAGDTIFALDSSGNKIPIMTVWPPPLPTPNINGALRRATLLTISNFDARSQDDPISPAVESLLMRLRDPALA